MCQLLLLPTQMSHFSKLKYILNVKLNNFDQNIFPYPNPNK